MTDSVDPTLLTYFLFFLLSPRRWFMVSDASVLRLFREKSRSFVHTAGTVLSLYLRDTFDCETARTDEDDDDNVIAVMRREIFFSFNPWVCHYRMKACLRTRCGSSPWARMSFAFFFFPFRHSQLTLFFLEWWYFEICCHVVSGMFSKKSLRDTMFLMHEVSWNYKLIRRACHILVTNID